MAKKNNFAKFFKKEKGLTLVDLIVSVSIVTLLTALITINWPDNSKIIFDRSVNELVKDLRKVQNMAISTAEYGDPVVLPCGYGIKTDIASSSYIIFYNSTGDCDSDNFIYDTDTTSGGLSTKIETVFLPTDIDITDSSDQAIYFSSPFAMAYIDSTVADTTVSLKHTPSGESKDIEIYSSGRIQIQ